MNLLDRIRRAVLTDYELTLYEFLENHDGNTNAYTHHMLHKEWSFFGKRIIKNAMRRSNQRILHADLMQRIANGGKSAEEMEKMQAERDYHDKHRHVDVATVPYNADIWPTHWAYNPVLKAEGGNVAVDPVDIMAAYKKDSGNGY